MNGICQISCNCTGKLPIGWKPSGSAFKAVNASFRTALNEADAFVFVGYSMEDPDFKRLYFDYRSEISLRKRNEKDTYVVSPPDNQFDYELKKAIWKTRGAVWIPLTAEDFFNSLRSVLLNTIDDEAKKKIMDKYGLKTDADFNEKVARIADLLLIDREASIRFLREAPPRSGMAA